MAEAAPRLYLITPRLTEASSFEPLLAAALDAGDVACVFLRLQTLAASESKKLIGRLAGLVQKHGAALLIEDPQLAARCDADGVHINGLGTALDSAIAAMKPDRIVGIGGLISRHDAMLAGETGVDYIMFGEPEAADVAEILERTGWWAEIFTLPCVAYAKTLADIASLVLAGADFIALGNAVWDDPRGAAAAVTAAQQALSVAEEPTP
jgi:thiamine-phosphate pyrophosphorylase